MQPLKSYLTKEGWKLDLEETRIRWLPGSPAEQIRYYIEKVLFKKIIPKANNHQARLKISRLVLTKPCEINHLLRPYSSKLVKSQLTNIPIRPPIKPIRLASHKNNFKIC